MKQLFFFILISSNITFGQGGGWKVIYQGSLYDSFSDCFFSNPDSGFVVGQYGLILKTIDGGLNWKEYRTTLPSSLLSVYFIGNKGWVCGSSDSKGLLLTTTDYGETWSEQYVFSGLPLTDVFFINDEIGFIVQQKSSVLKSTDGGLTWNLKMVESGKYLFETYFFSDSTGWICSYGLYKTSDQGQNWSKLSILGVEAKQVYFLDDLNGWIITEGSIFSTFILKTSDSGEHWQIQLDTDEGENVWRFSFINQNQGWAVGDFGLIWNTIDGGTNWIRQDSITHSRLFAVQFLNEKIGYAAGDGSTIIKTTTGGVTFIGEDNNNSVGFKLNQNYPNPFNPSTKISWQSPAGSWQTLKIYDVLGNEVATLVDEYKPAGRYEVEFDSHSDEGQNLSSGVYFYRLKVGSFIQTRKMIVLK